MSPLLNSSEVAKDTPVRHFSAFPLTSHMHTPTLRLVSLHPLLSVTLSFARVPEIHETFSWKVFFAQASTTKDIVAGVVEELGLAKTLPVPGAGMLEYALEEVIKDGKPEPEPRSLLFPVLISSQVIHDSRPQSVSQRFWKQDGRSHPPAHLPTISVCQTSGIEGARQGRYLRVP